MPSVWSPAGASVPQAVPAGTVLYQKFTATAGQTLFNITEFAYSVGVKALLVFKNGLALTPSEDFAETSSTSFTLLTPATLSDEILALGFTGIEGTVSVSDGTIKVTGADATLASLASKLQATSPLVATVTDTGGGALALVLSLDASNILENTETATVSGDFKYTGAKTDPANLATQADIDALSSGTKTATLNVYNHDTFNTFF